MYKKVLALVDGEVIDQKDDMTGIAPSIAIADAGVLDTGISDFTGHFNIDLGSDSAIIPCTIASDAEVLGTKIGAAVITTTKDTASSVNVYVEDGNIKIQNLTGGSVDVTARLF